MPTKKEKATAQPSSRKHYTARVRNPADAEAEPLRTTVTVSPAPSEDGAHGGRGVKVQFGPHAQGWIAAAPEPLELYIVESDAESLFAGTLHRTTQFTKPGDPPYLVFLEESDALIAMVYGEEKAE